MPYIPNGQSTLYYESRGAGDTIVFVHGAGGNHASFFCQLPAFSDRFRVVTYDARGFGNSTDTEQLGRAGNVPDLELLFDTLKIDKAILVAQSMGGGAAMGITCRQPGRVRGLVMADTVTGIDLPPDLRAELQATDERTKHLSQSERVLGVSTRQADPLAAILYQQIASFNHLTVRTLFGQGSEHTFEAIEATGCPVLFVVGTEDVLCPPALARMAHERLPVSTFVEIEGAGHSAYYEQPDRFNAVLDGWLQSLRTPA
jgi:3-oxoadipate enol-lactonase